MKRDLQSLRVLALGSALGAILAHGPAGADEAIAPQAESGASVATVAPGAMHDVRAAVRLVSQAALQRDFASDGQIRELLQAAHDLLASSERSLCCDALYGVAELKRDIAHMVARTDNTTDAWQSSDGVTIRPPNRDELNLLAKEGQALLRNSHDQQVLDRRGAFAAARKVASFPVRAGTTDSVSSPYRSWPATPSSPQALPLLTLNF